ncbi:hypothetical protein PoB_002972500 [Plakobranchus ocellatus]|uniref:Uncharacterized protein n=1 Tax=Plakobranchus ocellatus TaxID=259542 RepID=A0AAV4A4Z9_9GAST|nr:hypothetical protein PoB_002972500 [Plakobranchus ocellatus]
MFPWDDRGDGRSTNTTLLNTLAPVLVAHGLLIHENKLNELKGDNQKFSRGGDGIGFQPTIAHHYVFHVSMGRSRRWPPYRHHIAEHTSACARSPWTFHTRYDKASLASNQADQKLIHMCIPAS